MTNPNLKKKADKHLSYCHFHGFSRPFYQNPSTFHALKWKIKIDVFKEFKAHTNPELRRPPHFPPPINSKGAWGTYSSLGPQGIFTLECLWKFCRQWKHIMFILFFNKILMTCNLLNWIFLLKKYFKSIFAFSEWIYRICLICHAPLICCASQHFL